MHTKIFAPALLALTSLCLAQNAPAPPKADYSTAQGALKAFAQAVVAQDTAGVRRSLDIPAIQKPPVDAILAATDGVVHLTTAVRAKFGDDAAAQMRDPAALELRMTAWLKMLDTAAITQDGNDKVTYHFDQGPGGLPKAGSLTLIKTNGQWRVTAGSAFNLDDPAMAQKTNQAIPLFNKMAAAYNEVAAGVEAGKYASVKDVENAMNARVMALLPTEPATQK